MTKYTEEETNKMLQVLETITDSNEKSVIVSHIWWHHFSHKNHPRNKQLERLKKMLPYPKGEVSTDRMSELTKDIPKRFVDKLKSYVPPEFEGTHSKYSETKRKQRFDDSFIYTVSDQIMASVNF